MILLIDLLTRLQEDVPAVDSVPSAEQYQRAISDAVADFGRRVGRKKLGTLNIVSGTATYALPADFLKMICLPQLPHYGHGGILNTAAGLVPLPRHGLREDYSIVNGQITFRSAPRYTLAREYSYKAGFALTEDGYDTGYEDMDAEEAGIILTLAQSLAMGKQAAASSGSGLSYRQGDVSVDTTGQAQDLIAKSAALKAQYLEAVQNYIGTIVELG